MLIDSHVNLHAPQFAEDQSEVITRARQAGVGLMVTICDKVSAFDAVHAIAMAHEDIWCSVGTHPHEAKENPDLTRETLCNLAARPKVVGIGECGLDFHYDLSPREVQAQVFRIHCQAAHKTGLPLLVHTREADDVMAAILEDEMGQGAFKLLMHCYTSGPRLLDVAAEMGAWFSVSGIATFKQAEDVRDLVRMMPEDRIIVETDCPYLAPVPMRGRRNEPAYIGHVLAKLAEIRGWSAQEAEARTTRAFFNLFHTIPEPVAV